MKYTLLFLSTTVSLLIMPTINFGQAPNLGTASPFALFTAVGAFDNVGATSITGDAGTNSGAFTGFPPGNVNGIIHVEDAVSATAAVDVATAYGQLSALTCGTVIGVGLGNGQILTPGIYCTNAASTLNGNLTLDAQGVLNSIFIIKIDGALSTGIASSVVLINEAASCNVFWQINGALISGDNSVFIGTALVAGAITLNTGAILFGRGLSTTGAISTSANAVTLSLCGPPTIGCAADLGVSCAGLVPPPDINSVTVTVCSGPFTVVFLGDVISNLTCPNRFTITRTYKATDACGQTATCAQTITVDDQTAPAFTFCPPGANLGCNPAGVPAAGTATATDACGSPTIISSLGAITVNGCLRSQTRTYTATDACLNSSTCAQIFTWTEDLTAPAFTFCPPGENLGCNPAGVPAAGVATATDACGSPTIISALGAITANGCDRSQTRTYTATDACGNASICLQIFTWKEDLEPPTFTFCPLGENLGCPPAGIPGAGTATATDACGAPTITFTLGTITNNGCSQTQIRTYTATDVCGNSSACFQIFSLYQ